MYNPGHWHEFGALRAPGLLRLALECRVAWEYGATLAAQPLLSRAPRGDGHPVLVSAGRWRPFDRSGGVRGGSTVTRAAAAGSDAADAHRRSTA